MGVTTGYYVRIKRGDKFVAVDLLEMTDQELDKFFAEVAQTSPSRCANWASTLVKWIKAHVEEAP